MDANLLTFSGVVLAALAVNVPTWIMLRKNSRLVAADTELRTAEVAHTIQQASLSLIQQHENDLKECLQEKKKMAEELKKLNGKRNGNQ